MAEVVLTEENFETEVIKSDIPVLVDFWAEWCGPCKMISPILKDIAAVWEGKLKIGKLNVDTASGLAVKYGVVSIPTLKVFKGGSIVNEKIGAGNRQAIEALFKDLV
ncbi:MAG: thioredoxin [Spirochaetales bacterium]|nr:MAG: thioredoxin [Spirochaetales bacterium]